MAHDLWKKAASLGHEKAQEFLVSHFLEPERLSGVKLKGRVPLTDEEIALLPGVKRVKRGGEL